MSTTVEVPHFWTFHLPCCGAMFGAVVADQRFGGKYNGPVLVTEQQAWDDFYEGRKRRGNADRKRGVYVQASEDCLSLRRGHLDDCPTLDEEAR